MIEIEKEGSFIIIYYNGEYCNSLPKELFKKKLTFPQLGSREELCRHLDELLRKRAKSYALYLLSRQSYLRPALKMTLLRKGFSEETVESTLSELSDYLNDEENLPRLIEKEIEKGLGPFLIVQKLAAKGVHADLVQSLLAEKYPESLQKEKLTKLAKKTNKEGAKLYGYLQRRGFSLDVIYRHFS